jgi:hypothetical protein
MRRQTGRNIMPFTRVTKLPALVTAAFISSVAATSALAQDAMGAQYPNRDWLNGGQETPAAKMGLIRAGGAADLSRDRILDANAMRSASDTVRALTMKHRGETYRRIRTGSVPIVMRRSNNVSGAR